MFANENKPEFLNAAGNAQRAALWMRRYAHILWTIIGIGEDPYPESGEVVSISQNDVGTLNFG